MDLTYCYLCGTKLVSKSEQVQYCENCRQEFYANSKPCVEVALFNDKGEILLAKRGVEPYKGKYDLPGGFVDHGETNEEAILREIKEELGLSPEQLLGLRYVTSYSGDYPWGKETFKVLVAEFTARVGIVDIVGKDDVESVLWILPADINRQDLSVPQIWDIIQKTVKENQIE